MARILIVDDSAYSRVLMQLGLEAHGHAVTLAYGGHEALAMLSRDCPDVVVLDLTMPDMTGQDVLRCIAALPARPPVIVVTADEHPETERRCRELGAWQYLCKPVDMRRLLELVDIASGGAAAADRDDPSATRRQ